MRRFNSQDISGKRVLVRYDFDVLTDDKTVEDFRLRVGLTTLRFCLQYASQVILMGHVGRPEGEDLSLSVEPIFNWFAQNGFERDLSSKRLRILENLRFEPGEDEASLDYAKELADLGDYYINEAFAAYHPAASTTVLPTLLPHAAGLHFAKEVENLTRIRENPHQPLVVVMGGAKVEDKLPVIKLFAKTAEMVLVGGKLVVEIKEKGLQMPENVLIGELNGSGLDLAPESVESWGEKINRAKMIVWNGPIGKEDAGTAKLAQMILDTDAETVVGGGDTVSFLDQKGLLAKFQSKGFVSSGGGAMIKFLSEGTLPTIGVLTGV